MSAITILANKSKASNQESLSEFKHENKIGGNKYKIYKELISNVNDNQKDVNSDQSINDSNNITHNIDS